MKQKLLALLLAILLLFCTACHALSDFKRGVEDAVSTEPTYTLSEIPAFSDSPFVVLYDNEPRFTEKEKTDISYERYSELDSLGRCGAAIASIGKDLMPTEKRQGIGQIKPTGWQTVKYDSVDGKYLYNRCHLIGYQLSGENANEKNLITGTRFLNVEGMLPFENMVADYVKETGNHVLYRVTPVFEDDHLLASGVVMEAESVEDNGDGISFHVFCYNVQPGIVIDYKTGESALADETNTESYILNKNSKKFHLPDCESVAEISEKNRRTYQGKREALLAEGYTPCSRCHP